MHFFDRAKEDSLTIEGLETAEYQLNIFDDLSPKLQEEYLKYTLKTADEAMSRIGEIIEAWETGNAEKLNEIMQGEMKSNFPKLYQKMLIQRNLNWIPKLEELLAKEETPLIVVGAGHMVGPKGVVALLKKQGYVVEQL